MNQNGDHIYLSIRIARVAGKAPSYKLWRLLGTCDFAIINLNPDEAIDPPPCVFLDYQKTVARRFNYLYIFSAYIGKFQTQIIQGQLTRSR